MAPHPASFLSTVGRKARGVRQRLLPYSDYEQTIPPEILNDELYEAIRSVARTAEVDAMLEIGSSTGEGSTRAFVDGLHENPRRPNLYCMELARPRYERLVKRYAGDPQVHCYNVTSVPLECLPSEQELIDFYQSANSRLNRVPLREVQRWLQQDIRYMRKVGAEQRGIRMIREANGIERFGVVLIDGSEFTGPAELDEVYGADVILLDDIGTFKNHRNHARLLADPAYRLKATNPELRNGYSVFERIAQPAAAGAGSIPAARR